MNGGQVAKLWKLCFNDSTAFIRLFFHHFYSRQRTFSLFLNGQPVSALQVLPFSLTTSTAAAPLRLAYIAGCCTHPAFRSRGHMRRLLLTAIDSARKQGFDLAALIPASASLFEYYRTFGFTTSCFFSHSTYSFDSQTCNASAHRLLRLNGRSARRFFPFFARCFQQRNNCISFNSLHFHAAVADIILDNGDVFVLLDKPGGSPLALAFVLPAPPHSAGLPALPYVKEIVAIDESAQCAIFNHILRLHRAPSLFCRTPPDRNGCSPPLPYAMTLPLSLRASSLSSSGLYLNLMLD